MQRLSSPHDSPHPLLQLMHLVGVIAVIDEETFAGSNELGVEAFFAAGFIDGDAEHVEGEFGDEGAGGVALDRDEEAEDQEAGGDRKLGWVGVGEVEFRAMGPVFNAGEEAANISVGRKQGHGVSPVRTGRWAAFQACIAVIRGIGAGGNKKAPGGAF